MATVHSSEENCNYPCHHYIASVRPKKDVVINMNIQGFQKTTLLDFPGRVAATVFFSGCNFRCPFCHNGDLVLSPDAKPAFSPDEVLSYLKKRSRILDGVCVTGGEPTLQTDLAPFLAQIKDLGLAVKLDTNGYRPEVLKTLCREGLVDYVAMDIKGAPDQYARICGLSQLDFSRIEASVCFLKEGSVDYEFRTTVVRELHEEKDFAAIGTWIAGAKAYYLQGYQDSARVISPGFTAYSLTELLAFRELLEARIPHVEIRGVEQ